jgi:hypothetical protein
VVWEESCFPVEGLIWIILIPVHQLPKDSHHLPSSSTKRLGSMALKSLEEFEV